MLAAALERTLAPARAVLIIEALQEAGLDQPEALARAQRLELTEALRQADTSLPATTLHTLRRLARWIHEQHQGSTDHLAQLTTENLRQQLLDLGGIGPATADAILLYALDHPVYPVDRASFRVFVRHGWVEMEEGYDEARLALESIGGGDVNALKQLAAGLERIGREACRVSEAHCERCPLQPLLPLGGPKDPQ
jgi:endonuclease III related protein